MIVAHSANVTVPAGANQTLFVTFQEEIIVTDAQAIFVTLVVKTVF